MRRAVARPATNRFPAMRLDPGTIVPEIPHHGLHEIDRAGTTEIERLIPHEPLAPPHIHEELTIKEHPT